MALTSLILLTTHIVLPVFFLVSLWWPKPADRLDWAMRVIYGAVFMAFIVVVGRWDWISIYMAAALPLAFAACVLVSGLGARKMPWREPGGRSVLRRHAFTAAMTLVFLVMTVKALTGYRYDEEPVALAFPMAPGSYYIGQGGGDGMINHHAANRSQRFALDIVALNAAGARASGLYPTDPARYVIFGRTVVSPCSGLVVSVEDGVPDNRPPATDIERVAGNHVVLACGSVRVLLAHLEEGSVDVDEGELAIQGQPLGRVGNSGNSTEPHLHLHAFWNGNGDINAGIGVPMTFAGRFLVRGSRVTVP